MLSVIWKLNRDDMFPNIKDGFRKEWYVKPIKKKTTSSLENERQRLILKAQNKTPKQLLGREGGGWRAYKHEIGPDWAWVCPRASR